jgi:hypothetical protein
MEEAMSGEFKTDKKNIKRKQKFNEGRGKWDIK